MGPRYAQGHRRWPVPGFSLFRDALRGSNNEPEQVVPDLASFIEGEDCSEASAVILEDVLQTANTDALYGWKRRLNRQQSYLCEAAAKPVLEACGYETEYDDPRISSLRVAYYLSGSFIRQGVNHIYGRMTNWRLE